MMEDDFKGWSQLNPVPQKQKSNSKNKIDHNSHSNSQTSLFRINFAEYE